MNIWKKLYTLRRYTEQKNNKGYFSQGHRDIVVSLDVQPITGTQTQVTVNGKRMSTNIKAYGSFPIQVEDAKKGTKADWLFFDGAWYECNSCVHWEHTPLAHYRSQFVLVSEAIKDDEKVPPEPVKEPEKVPEKESGSAEAETPVVVKKTSSRKKKSEVGVANDG